MSKRAGTAGSFVGGKGKGCGEKDCYNVLIILGFRHGNEAGLIICGIDEKDGDVIVILPGIGNAVGAFTLVRLVVELVLDLFDIVL